LGLRFGIFGARRRVTASLFREEKKAAAFGNSKRVFFGVPSCNRNFVFCHLLDLVLFVGLGLFLGFRTVRVARFLYGLLFNLQLTRRAFVTSLLLSKRNIVALCEPLAFVFSLGTKNLASLIKELHFKGRVDATLHVYNVSMGGVGAGKNHGRTRGYLQIEFVEDSLIFVELTKTLIKVVCHVEDLHRALRVANVPNLHR
jgi:hypothetical protein